MIEEILENNLSKSNSSIVTKEYQKLFRKLSIKFEGEQLHNQICYKLKQKGFSMEEIESIDR